MYQRAAFTETRPKLLHQLMRAHPLATLITAGPGGLMANALPVLCDADGGPHGVLRAHIARANPQARELAAGAECLLVFQGPQHYISPGWYASKQLHGKVVPTWNYAVVQVRGTPRLVEDAAWLRQQLDDLTRLQEGIHAAPLPPWQVADAPADYIEATMRAIVGLEIPIAHIEGKWKMSQNGPPADRAWVIAGLHGRGNANADDVAALVADHAPGTR